MADGRVFHSLIKNETWNQLPRVFDSSLTLLFKLIDHFEQLTVLALMKWNTLKWITFNEYLTKTSVDWSWRTLTTGYSGSQIDKVIWYALYKTRHTSTLFCVSVVVQLYVFTFFFGNNSLITLRPTSKWNQ